LRTLSIETVVFITSPFARRTKKRTAPNRSPVSVNFLSDFATHRGLHQPRCLRSFASIKRRKLSLVIMNRSFIVVNYLNMRNKVVISWEIIFIKQPNVKWLYLTSLQSFIGSELLSKGSAHLGSASEWQTQHFMDKPSKK